MGPKKQTPRGLDTRHGRSSRSTPTPQVNKWRPYSWRGCRLATSLWSGTATGSFDTDSFDAAPASRGSSTTAPGGETRRDACLQVHTNMFFGSGAGASWPATVAASRGEGRRFAAEEVWKSSLADAQSDFSSTLYHDGYLYAQLDNANGSSPSRRHDRRTVNGPIATGLATESRVDLSSPTAI